MLTFEDSSGVLQLMGSLFSSGNGKIIVKLANATYYADQLCFIPCGKSQFKATNHTIDLLVTLLEDQTCVLKIKNTTNKNIHIEEVVIDFAPSTFSPPLQARDYRQLIHSRDFETVSHIKPIHLPSEFTDKNPESGMVTVYSHNATRNALLVGTLPPFGSALSYISPRHESLHKEGLFGIKIRFEFQQDLAPAADISTSPLVMIEDVSGEKTLEKYGEMIRTRLNRPQKAIATGWNTWDYYAGAITRQDIDENITVLKKTFGPKLKYIVLDAGWECMWGVWQANWKFPEGLEDLCRHVKANGYIPGIWTAPLMVNYYTPLYRNHPDWFVSNADGNVYLTNLSYGTMAQLDITLPAVQNHLRQIYTNLRKFGFEYFKVDFTQMILGANLFHDTHVGRGEIIRILFKLIRESIGEESYLLSCGAPFESIIGIADACRISSDIHNHWSMIAQNIQCFFARAWMQGTIGNIDPDFLIIRNSDTTNDHQLNRRLPTFPRSKGPHWIDGAEMTMEEAKVLALAIHLTGGDIILSDVIGKLNVKGIDILEKVILPLSSPAKPINLFEPEGSHYPILFATRKSNDLLGVFNLTEDTVTRKIDLSFLETPLPLNAIDFWTGQVVPITSNFQLTLSPRSARGLIIPHTVI